MVIHKKQTINEHNKSTSTIGIPSIFFKNKGILNFNHISSFSKVSDFQPSLHSIKNPKRSIYGERLCSRIKRIDVPSSSYLEQQMIQGSKILESKKRKFDEEEIYNQHKKVCLQVPFKSEDFSESAKKKDLGVKPFVNINSSSTKNQSFKSKSNFQRIRTINKEYTFQDGSSLLKPLMLTDTEKRVQTPLVNKEIDRNGNNVLSAKELDSNFLKPTLDPDICKPIDLKIAKPNNNTFNQYKTKSISQLLSEIDNHRLIGNRSNKRGMISKNIEQRSENIKNLLMGTLSNNLTKDNKFNTNSFYPPVISSSSSLVDSDSSSNMSMNAVIKSASSILKENSNGFIVNENANFVPDTSLKNINSNDSATCSNLLITNKLVSTKNEDNFPNLYLNQNSNLKQLGTESATSSKIENTFSESDLVKNSSNNSLGSLSFDKKNSETSTMPKFGTLETNKFDRLQKNDNITIGSSQLSSSEKLDLFSLSHTSMKFNNVDSESVIPGKTGNQIFQFDASSNSLPTNFGANLITSTTSTQSNNVGGRGLVSDSQSQVTLLGTLGTTNINSHLLSGSTNVASGTNVLFVQSSSTTTSLSNQFGNGPIGFGQSNSFAPKATVGDSSFGQPTQSTLFDQSTAGNSSNYQITSVMSFGQSSIVSAPSDTMSFGQKAPVNTALAQSTSVAKPFCQSNSINSTSFGMTSSNTKPMNIPFGTNTTSTLSFSQTISSTISFGQSNSVSIPFGQIKSGTVQTASSPVSFSQSNPVKAPFNQTISGTIPFGQSTSEIKAFNQSSLFGQSKLNTLSFDQSMSGGTSFGKTLSTSTSFGQNLSGTSVNQSNSIFGQDPSNVMSFGQSNTSGASFCQTSSGTTLFGQPSNTMAFGNSVPSSTPFGQTASNTTLFGQPSNTIAFGQSLPSSTPFGQSTSSTNLFGQTSNTMTVGESTPCSTQFGETKSIKVTFGQAPTGNSSFGQTSYGGNLFGQTTSSTTLFGKSPSNKMAFSQLISSTTTSSQVKTSMMTVGQAQSEISSFGQSAPGSGLFGQTTSSSIPFGQTQSVVLSFGQATPSSTTFGQTTSSIAHYGQTVSGTTSFCGQPTPVSSIFGQSTSTNMFGQSATKNGFGQSTTESGKFGQSPLLFGQTNLISKTLDQNNGTLFGSSNNGNTLFGKSIGAASKSFENGASSGNLLFAQTSQSSEMQPATNSLIGQSSNRPNLFGTFNVQHGNVVSGANQTIGQQTNQNVSFMSNLNSPKEFSFGQKASESNSFIFGKNSDQTKTLGTQVFGQGNGNESNSFGKSSINSGEFSKQSVSTNLFNQNSSTTFGQNISNSDLNSNAKATFTSSNSNESKGFAFDQNGTSFNLPTQSSNMLTSNVFGNTQNQNSGSFNISNNSAAANPQTMFKFGDTNSTGFNFGQDRSQPNNLFSSTNSKKITGRRRR